MPLPPPPREICSTDFSLKHSYKTVRRDFYHAKVWVVWPVCFSWHRSAMHIFITRSFPVLFFPRVQSLHTSAPPSSLCHTQVLYYCWRKSEHRTMGCCTTRNTLCNADKKQTLDTILLTKISRAKSQRMTHMLEVPFVLRHVAESASDRRGGWRMPWPRLEATSWAQCCTVSNR